MSQVGIVFGTYNVVDLVECDRKDCSIQAEMDPRKPENGAVLTVEFESLVGHQSQSDDWMAQVEKYQKQRENEKKAKI
jgi:hypothetical protein